MKMGLSMFCRGTVIVFVLVASLFAAPVWAQELEGQTSKQTMEPAEIDPTYDAPYGWYISFVSIPYLGGAVGANPIGTVVDEENEKTLTFDLGSGGFYSGRAGRRVWWRLGVEGEFGYGSPGVEVTETNLQGRNITTSDFGDYSVGFIAVSARLDLTDSRFTPFLLSGPALVLNRIGTDTGTEGKLNPGFLFGGGMEVELKDNFYLRSDLRGLRSQVNAPLLSGGRLLPTVDDLGFRKERALSTMWLWSIGVTVRFD
jgi:hypothetical protein|tara:strand:- start:688 stop:1458 length:771 start_codon:yes stop_codon:yes gene_type:complete